MELVVNIGNTNFRFGVFLNDVCLKSWVIRSKPFKSEDEYFIQFKSMFHHYKIKKNEIKKIIIGSVVPPITIDICKVLKKVLNLNIILVNRNTPSHVIHKSNQIGTDLYANAVSAYYNYEIGNKIVIDFGTAFTFIGIDQKGNIKGVVIAPGLHSSLNSLISNTTQLTGIELRKPITVLGKNTEHSMQSGIIYGFLSMVEGLIERINKELSNNNSSKTIVIATGGLVKVFSHCNLIDFNDQLHTLKGLKILGDSI